MLPIDMVPVDILTGLCQRLGHYLEILCFGLRLRLESHSQQQSPFNQKFLYINRYSGTGFNYDTSF